MQEIKKISVIGAGSWGTTLAVLLGKKGYKVSLWTRREETSKEINSNKENKQYLKNIKIPNTVTATHSIEDTIKDSNLVIFAIPSSFLREVTKLFSKFINKDIIIMHVVKGVEESTGKLMSQILKEELGNEYQIAVLSGPNHAEEVAQNLPTATVIASENKNISKILCNVFTTPNFKPFPLHDVVGVEICSVIKNIIAIAIGVCGGLKLGDNAKASILTLGISEMSQLAVHFGSKKSTCYGLAGIGDSIVTCYSHHSRNRFVGEMLTKGKNIEQIKNEMHGMVAEGIKNTKTIYELCNKNKIDTTLISQVHKVLYENMDIKEAITQLLNRV
jgi:glycerol-3-phosphate dehydrogenase (NAD(P)+)